MPGLYFFYIHTAQPRSALHHHVAITAGEDLITGIGTFPDRRGEGCVGNKDGDLAHPGLFCLPMYEEN